MRSSMLCSLFLEALGRIGPLRWRYLVSTQLLLPVQLMPSSGSSLDSSETEASRFCPRNFHSLPAFRIPGMASCPRCFAQAVGVRPGSGDSDSGL